MLDSDFDPDKFIDREAEQELFDQLLKFKDDARLLTIQDKGGRGKSNLLRRLKYNCEWRNEPPIPVSLVHLDQLSDYSSFTLINTMLEDLAQSPTTVSFTRFEALNKALAARNWAEFVTQPGNVTGSADVGGATISGHNNIVGGIVYNYGGDWTPAQEELARGMCVDAFLEDLKATCQNQPLVILLDAWERGNGELNQWIVNHMIRRYVLHKSQRPAQFVVVMAGREIPNFKAMLGEALHTSLARSIESLGAWQEEHVKAFLRVHGYEDITDDEVAILCARIRDGMSLERALQVVALLVEG